VREIGWYRTYQLRELLAQMFDRCPSSRLEKLESVELDYRWQSDEDQIDAVWLIAFLAGQLGWSPVDRSDNEQWQFQRSDHKVRVSLRRQEAHRGGLDRIKLTSEQNTYEASRRGQASDEFQIRLCDHATCQMPRSVQVTRRSSAGHLAAALNGRQHDAAFARAAPIADWMFSS
jgi:glucose-6-phosphate dehydrogenase assembly protein OpcA